MNNVSVQLGAVQETLLSTLYARAIETKKKHGILHDQQALDMVNRIDYDFTIFEGSPTLFGSVLRTLMLDYWVRQFIAKHPNGTVVELGAGLNTRFERVDNGSLHWVDIDLADSMLLRRKFFTESARRKLVDASITDESWVARVQELPGPYFFVTEGVLLYLTEDQVRQALGLITQHFPAATLAFDTAGQWMLDNQNAEVFRKKVAATFSWACDDPRIIQDWGLGLQLQETRTLLQLPQEVRRNLPLRVRFILGAVRARYGRQSDVYRVNLFTQQGHI